VAALFSAGPGRRPSPGLLYGRLVPAEPQVVWMPGGVRTEIHLTGDDTGGAFCLLVDHPGPGWSLPPHIHTDAAETIHVIEGEFEIAVDGASERLGPGQTVHVPAGVVHSGANVGPGPGRRLLTFAPAGMEEFFRAAGAPSADAEVDRGAALAAALHHGWRFT
jgi:quercetin dioxygenase-like cupin family protein